MAFSITRRSLTTMTTHLLPSRSANLGILTLNNPKTLNALDLDMVRALNHILPLWQSDPTMRATLMLGAHCKRPAFCAGGDVKSVYMSGKGLSGVQADEDAAATNQHGYGKRGLLTADFFREEYQMNHRIATQDHDNMPQVSIWDGVVMGGGVGVSLHGKYRVATENTLFAKPETAIGLFPDVGGMWWLPRLPGGIGSYIALTGQRLRADDLLYAGLATHYVPADKIDDLRLALVDATKTSSDDEQERGDDSSTPDVAEARPEAEAPTGDCVAPMLMAYHDAKDVKPSESFLALNRADIDAVFGNKDSKVEDIIVSLEEMSGSGSSFAADTLEALKKMSPTSLKVTHEGIRRGADLRSIGEVLKMEYRMSQAFMRNHDFYEGIRAVLVDKDQSPKWKPDSLEDVTDDIVASYFEDLGENELVLESVKKTSNL